MILNNYIKFNFIYNNIISYDVNKKYLNPIKKLLFK